MSRLLLAVLITVLLSGCQGPTKSSDAASSPPPDTAEAPRPLTTNPSGAANTVGDPPAPLLPAQDRVDACVAACVQARQMEAVGAEVIEATCRDQCRADPKAYPR